MIVRQSFCKLFLYNCRTAVQNNFSCVMILLLEAFVIQLNDQHTEVSAAHKTENAEYLIIQLI